MGLMRTTTLCAAVAGDTLGLALVATGPFGARVIRSDSAPASDATAPERLAAAATRFLDGDRATETILVAPAAWCVARELAVTPAEWTEARAGVLESLEDLLPMAAGEAVVGVLGLFDEQERCTRGALTAAPRERVEALSAAIRNASGARRERVISSTMATLGLGLEGEERVSVVESDGAAELSLELRYGLPIAFDEPAPRSSVVRRLGVDVPAEELAQAGPRALLAAGGAIAPLVGAKPQGWSRVAVPAAAGALAIALVASAPAVWSARLESGADAAAAERAALRDDLASARQARSLAEERLELASAFDDATSEWSSALPALRDAAGALDEAGFLYRLQIEGDAMTMTGEAADVGAVLERLEASPSLTSVGTTAPLTSSPTDPGLSVFTIRAEVVR